MAVELAARLLGDLASRRVLVIGAGENGELTARALRERGVHTVFVANRRYDRAIGLAQRFGGDAVRFDDLPAELLRAPTSSCRAPARRTRSSAARSSALVMRAARGRPLLI